MPTFPPLRALGLAMAFFVLVQPDGAVAESDEITVEETEARKEAAAEDPALDVIELKNGSVILGKVAGLREGSVSIDTEFAGTLTISSQHIASVRTSQPVIVQMADDTVIRDQPLLINEDQLVVDPGTGSERSYALEELVMVNPEPWEIGQGYNWTGLASLATNTQRGNTDKRELDYRLETFLRSDDDRYTIRLSGELDETNGEKNVDKWAIIGSYDYFFDGPTFWGVNAFAESDEFTNLDLRYFIGPYIGRQFFTAPVFSLEAQVGASYVSVDYIDDVDEETGESLDENYPGANWEVHFTSNYLGGESRIYLDQLGIWNLNNLDDVVINNIFGVAFPLLWSIEGAAEIVLNYDSGAVPGVEKLDETYRFRVGYSW